MAKGPKKDYRKGGVGAGKAGAGPLANPTSASSVPATAEATAPTATAAIVQAVQESQVFVEGPYRIRLPKNPRRLTIDVTREALAERGYEYRWDTYKWKTNTVDVRFPDGVVRNLTGNEVRDILYPKKPKPPR
jgi:hypothetical protein